MMRRRAFLDGIAYRVGEPEPIAAIEPIAQDEGLLAMLTALGMDRYRKASVGPTQLATAAVLDTLRLTGRKPEQIDALVYATTSFTERSGYGLDVGRLCIQVGLPNVTPVGVFMAECGNLMSALRVAQGLMAAEGCNNVLVVTADTCPSPSQRLVTPAVSVLSDGAASCLLTRSESRIELLGIEQRSDQRIREIDNKSQFVKTMSFTANGVEAAARTLMKRLELLPDDVSQLIMNNYTASVARVFAARCGVPLNRVYARNLAAFAHVFSADVLINLDHHLAEGDRAERLVLALGTGVCTWGLAALRLS